MANCITLRIELQGTTTPQGIGVIHYEVWQCFPGGAGIGEVKIAQVPEQYPFNLRVGEDLPPQIDPKRPALGENVSNKPSHAGDKRMTVIADEEMNIPPSTRSISRDGPKTYKTLSGLSSSPH